MTMDDLAVLVREADTYLRRGECVQASQSCLTAAGIARALWLRPSIETTLLETAANLLELARLEHPQSDLGKWL